MEFSVQKCGWSFNTGCFLAINSAGLEGWQITDTYIRLLTSFTKGMNIINPFFASRLSCFLFAPFRSPTSKTAKKAHGGSMGWRACDFALMWVCYYFQRWAYVLHTHYTLEKTPTHCVAVASRETPRRQVTLLSLFLPQLIDQQPAATGEFRATLKMADTLFVTHWYNRFDVDWSGQITKKPKSKDLENSHQIAGQ